jgi:hypothetical protein
MPRHVDDAQTGLLADQAQTIPALDQSMEVGAISQVTATKAPDMELGNRGATSGNLLAGGARLSLDASNLRSTAAAPLEYIEQRGVSAAFLVELTKSQLTDDMAEESTAEAVEFLKKKIKEIEDKIEQERTARANPHLQTETQTSPEPEPHLVQLQQSESELDPQAGLTRHTSQQMAALDYASKNSIGMLERNLRQHRKDLEKREKQPYLTSRDVHRLLVVEKTKDTMCRYVELPDVRNAKHSDGRPKISTANYFFSYSWDSPWDSVVSALHTHTQRQVATGKPPPYYWVDIFAVNQHTRDAVHNGRSLCGACSTCRANKWDPLCDACVASACQDCAGCKAVGEDMHDWATADPNYLKGFERVIAKTKHTLVLNEPWDCPRPPTRVWCLFEGYQTLARGGKLEVVLDQASEQELQLSLAERFRKLQDIVAAIDSRLADATVERDRDNIFDAIERLPGGFGGLNEQMQAAQARWLFEAAQGVIYRTNPRRLQLDEAAMEREAAEIGEGSWCPGLKKLLFFVWWSGVLVLGFFALAAVNGQIPTSYLPANCWVGSEHLGCWVDAASFAIALGATSVLAAFCVVIQLPTFWAAKLTRLLERRPQLGRLTMMLSVFLMVGCFVELCVYEIVSSGSGSGIDSDSSDDKWYSIAGVIFLAGFILLAWGLHFISHQKARQLRQPPLLGNWATRQYADGRILGIWCFVMPVSTVVFTYHFPDGSNFAKTWLAVLVLLVGFLVYFAIALPLKSARDVAATRAALRVLVGWLQLRLDDAQGAVAQLREAHEQLQDTVGVHDVFISWVAAAPYARALCEAGRPEEAMVLRDRLDEAERYASSCPGIIAGSGRWRMWKQYGQLLRAGMAAAVRAPDVEVLDVLLENKTPAWVPAGLRPANNFYEKGGTEGFVLEGFLPEWAEFLARMAEGGNEEDRRRWAAYRVATVRNLQLKVATIEKDEAKQARLVASLFELHPAYEQEV